jgi:transposase-like protein
MNIFEIFKKFPNEKDAVDYYIKIRYDKNVVCPHCGNIISIYRYRKYIKLFQCNKCQNTFSVFTGSIFEKTKTDIRKWFLAITLILNAKRGISGYQLMRDINVTYKCAWRILNKIREAMYNDYECKILGKLYEMDETFIGGKPRERTEHKKDGTVVRVYHKRGRGTDKIPVVGIIERKSGNIYTQVMNKNKEGKKLSGKQLYSVIEKVCSENSKIITDDFRGYDILDNNIDKKYRRFSVNHSAKQYVAGKGIHTNNMESHWSLIKRSWYGVYYHYSKKYMKYYINEFRFRKNHRGDINKFDSLLKQALLREPVRKYNILDVKKA